jgi:predicted nucleotidyltransferase
MALHAGVDLVLEIPVWFATASAEFFARGAMGLLQATGIVDAVCFGAESLRVEELQAAAKLLAQEPAAFKKILRARLAAGASYPQARDAALVACGCAAPRQPNDILALEYCKALGALGWALTPHVVRRQGAYHGGSGVSAAAARAALAAGDHGALRRMMPPPAYALWMADTDQGARLGDLNRLSDIFKYLLLTRGTEWAATIADVGEGLERRLAKAAAQGQTLEEILALAATKRYVQGRLRRAALHMLLDLGGEAFRFFAERGPQYIRVLGFRRKKAYLLGAIAQEGRVPLVMNLKRDWGKLSPDGAAMLQKEVLATDLYALAQGVPKPAGAEYRQPIVVL